MDSRQIQILDLSHSIKNILQAIRGARDVIQVGLEKDNLETVRRSWGILDRNIDLIQKLVLDMLRFSEERPPTLVDCDFNSIVASVVEPLSHQAIGIELDHDIPPGRMDPERIYDMVLNLLLNAIQAVGPAGGNVTITTSYDADSDSAVLTVADNGPGIEDTESIFEPFWTTRKKDGLGLGLPIARKIIMQHNGKIQVQSTPGKGATFTVTLPIHP